jgi:hypothetical protein
LRSVVERFPETFRPASRKRATRKFSYLIIFHTIDGFIVLVSGLSVLRRAISVVGLFRVVCDKYFLEGF